MLDGQPSSWPVYPDAPVDVTIAAPCLEGLGLTVYGDSSGVSYTEPGRPEMSTAEEAAREQLIAACYRAAVR
jgi:hypothetical protein